MTPSEITPELILEENQQLQLGNYEIKIVSNLGLFIDIHYFKVEIKPLNDENLQLGLLRIGSLQSGLKRELALRDKLNDYGMIVKILAKEQKNNILINSDRFCLDLNSNSVINSNDEFKDSSEAVEEESDYLEEEFYPETHFDNNITEEKILILSDYPHEYLTLANWLKEEHTPEEILSLIIQICQCLSYICQKKWCIINFNPHLIEVNQGGKPLQFFDLTNAYPFDYKPELGLSGDYYAPELALAHPINELMSSYTINLLLYQAFHQKLIHDQALINYEIKPIPRIYQILKIGLSHIPEERFYLAQLRDLLVETRKGFRQIKIHWNVASNSTIGLSTQRLQNEDNYGIRQQKISNYDTLILGVVADGMGGMAQGEVASQIAVNTFLKEPIPEYFSTIEQRNTWLLDLCQKANQLISEQVNDGGTTLSVVLAINDDLMIAHIGDSRIYHLRKGEIQQISEDHSLVAMLVANGEITEEESLEHPDRNVLLKSLGSKRHLSNGYVQTLNRTLNNLSIKLENEDILLLCSDGVWDLVPKGELLELFNSCNPSETRNRG